MRTKSRAIDGLAIDVRFGGDGRATGCHFPLGVAREFRDEAIGVARAYVEGWNDCHMAGSAGIAVAARDDADDPDDGPEPVGVALVVNGCQFAWFGVATPADLATELRDLAQEIDDGDHAGTLAALGIVAG